MITIEFMNKINKNLLATIKGMVANESIQLEGNRSEILNQLTQLNLNGGYKLSVLSGRGKVTVTRQLPDGRYNRTLYIASLTKQNVKKALKTTDNNYTKAAETLSISARSLGRLKSRYSI